MKRVFLGASMLMAVTAIAVTPSMAQTIGGHKQFTVKVGINAPTKSDVRSASSTWAAGGLEYAFGETDAGSVNSMELLYTAASGDHTPVLQQTINERYRTWSLMFNHKIRRVPQGQFGTPNVLFYGAGLGADLIDLAAE